MSASSVVPWFLLVAGIVSVLVFVTVLVLLSNGQRQREWEHSERMKALEFGTVLPARPSPWPTTLAAVAIGAVVPLGAMFFGWMASLPSASESVGPGFPWEKAWPISAIALVCGTVLALRIPGSRRLPNRFVPMGKPMVDAEALEDLEARRG